MQHDQGQSAPSRSLRVLCRSLKVPRRICARIVLSVLACLLLVVPVFLLYQNEVDSRGFQPLGSSATPLDPPKDNYYGVPTEVYSADSSGTSADFCVTFEFLGLDPSVPDVTLGILMGVTGPGKKALLGLSAKGFKNVSLVVKSDSGLSNFEAPVLVSVLAAAPVTNCGTRPLQNNLDQNAAYRVTWTPSLLGQPRAFPQDWYELDDSVGVIAGQSQNGQALPSSLVMMSRDEDLRVGVQIDQASHQDLRYQHLPYRNLPSAHQLFFTVHRPPWIVTYTYWVAAMPFLLLIALLSFKLIAQRRPLEPSDAAFGLAAAMVAILPLHQVLVPGNIPGLTRLDVLFGLGICFLVAASVLGVVVWVPGEQPKTPPASGGAEAGHEVAGADGRPGGGAAPGA
jgi:hypothetical protein